MSFFSLFFGGGCNPFNISHELYQKLLKPEERENQTLSHKGLTFLTISLLKKKYIL